jgi:nucleoside-diphosphate-sugar epimerase
LKVLITGATGMLGGVLVEHLLDQGHQVRALVRASSDTTALQALGVEIVVGSLHPPQGLEAALAGCDHIVHCAGGGRVQSASELIDNNARTTTALITAAEIATPRLRRFVLISSIAAQGPSSTAEGPAQTTTAPLTKYGQAKAMAESAALLSELPVTVLRPPVIYGPRDWRMIPLFKLIHRGWAFLPATAQTTAIVHHDDVASAITAVLQEDHPAGQILTVANPTPVTHAELIHAIAEAIGRPVRLHRIPVWVLRLLGWFGGLIGRLRPRGVLLHSDKVRELCQAHWVCGGTSLADISTWRPAISLVDGLAQTAATYRTTGSLPPA